jgi:hypothetical protein
MLVIVSVIMKPIDGCAQHLWNHQVVSGQS